MNLKELIFVIPVLVVASALLYHYAKEKLIESKKKELPK